MKKYFIYARKSTDSEDRQILSIEAQIAELQEFIKRKEDVSIVDTFIESRTAKEPGRPVFNKMIEKIKKGEAEGIIAWHPDRLARNSVDGGMIIHLIDKEIIQFLEFPTYKFDNSAQGKFMLNIIFGQSKYYVDNLSENVKRGIRQKLRRGEYPRLAPIGYINNPRTRKIDIDEKKAELVKQLFDVYSKGDKSLRDLRNFSIDIGLTTPVSGTAPSKSNLQQILSNPFYYGLFKIKGELYEGCHEPLISKDLYDKVQLVLHNKAKPKKIKYIYALTGLIQCSNCGCMITAEKQKGHIYYRCTKKRTKCDLPYIREEKLGQQINKIIKQLIIDKPEEEYLFSMLSKEKESLMAESRGEISKLEDSIKDYDNKINRLLELYLDGQLAKREYAKQKEVLLNNKHKNQQELNRLNRGQYTWLERLESFINSLDATKNIYQTDDLNLKKEFIQKVGSNLKLWLKSGGGNTVETSLSVSPINGTSGQTVFGGGGAPYGRLNTGFPAIKIVKSKPDSLVLELDFKDLWFCVADWNKKSHKTHAVSSLWLG